MVDHFSDLTYLNLTGNTIQEETLSGKATFEIWAAKFEIKVKIYHSDNGIFDEKPSDQKLSMTIRL